MKLPDVNTFGNRLITLLDIALVLSSYLRVEPYSSEFDIVLPCRIYAFVRLLYFFFVRKMLPTKHESIILAALSIIPCAFFCVQSVALQSKANMIAGLGSVSYLLAGYYIYKYIGLKEYCKYLFWFSVVNIVGIVVWVLFGSPEIIPTPGNGRHTHIYALNFLSILQHVNYEISSFETAFLKVRFNGFTANSNALGFVGAFGMIYFSFIKMTKKRWWYSIGTYAMILLLTQSRASFLFILIYYVTRQFFQAKITISKIMQGTLIATVLVGGGWFLNSLRGGGDITSQRLFFIETLWKLYWENDIISQLFGVGYRNLHAFLWSDSMINWLSPDNSYFPLLLENGAIGFCILYGSVLFSIFYACTRNKKGIVEGIPFLFALFAYSHFENCMFLGQNSYGYLAYLFYLTERPRNDYGLQKLKERNSVVKENDLLYSRGES